MTRARSRVRVLVLVLTAAASGVAPAPARAQGESTPHLLEVPYLPQTEALCGGAAAAMVMRYWGDRDIYPDAFAALVDRRAGGIRTSVLEAALKERSWTVLAGPGNSARAVRQIDRGRPVIALIEDRPGKFHYVVVVAWADRRIVLHDPARTPFRVVDETSFARSWKAANNWMLVALPPDGRAVPITHGDVAATTTARSSGPCSSLVEEGVRLAGAGDRHTARAVLQRAATTCPRESGPWREIAGLDAIEGNWSAAEEHARAAVERDDRDEHAWRILGTAAYLRDRHLVALDAWNQIGEPVVDLVDVKGWPARGTRSLPPR